MPRLGGALDIVQVSDPATPIAGRQFLYFKSDGHLYTKLPSAAVVQVDVTPQNPIAQIEVDVTAALGGPARSGRFTIADASFLVGHQLYVAQGGDPISTKGTLADENDMDALTLRGVVTGAGAATVYWSSQTYVKGRFPINYRSS